MAVICTQHSLDIYQQPDTERRKKNHKQKEKKMTRQVGRENLERGV